MTIILYHPLPTGITAADLVGTWNLESESGTVSMGSDTFNLPNDCISFNFGDTVSFNADAVMMAIGDKYMFSVADGDMLMVKDSSDTMMSNFDATLDDSKLTLMANETVLKDWIDMLNEGLDEDMKITKVNLVIV